MRITFEEDKPYSYYYEGKHIEEAYKSYKRVSEMMLNTMPNIDSQIQVHKWEEVLPHLHDAVSRIEVKEINGGSADILNYYDHKQGLSVIAIGGDKLSRGLTLEGLSVSYYLRASRMYDTLMQMGRWFGYRPGYVDLCRLFTSRELNEWFCHITLASEELRDEFDYMSDIAGSTPEQYALKVRSHPGVLQISASNKIRNAINIEVSWSGRLVETYQLQKNEETIASNLSTTIDLIRTLTSPTEIKSNCYLWKNISIEYLRPFFQGFKVAESLKRVEPASLLQFIELQAKNNELTNWSIGVMSKKDAFPSRRYKLEHENSVFDIGYYLRNGAEDRGNDYFIRKNHIISPRDEFIDLEESVKERALQRTIEFHRNNNKEYKNEFPRGEIVRNEFRSPQNPLLLIYFLDPEGAGIKDNNVPIIGFAISFPKSNFSVPVRYSIHQQLLPLFNEENIDDDQYDED